MADGGWLSAYVFYESSLDPLIVDVMAPLMAELAADGLAERSFFLRYWEGGSHLRLRIWCLDRHRDRVRKRVASRFQRFLDAHPAPDGRRADRHQGHADRYANLEGMTEYATELHANNSVEFIPYLPEHHRYGTGRLMAAVENHFVESSRIVLQLLRGPLTDRRETAAFGLIALAWWVAAESDPLPWRLADQPDRRDERWGAYGLLGQAQLAQLFARQQPVLRRLVPALRATLRRAEGPARDGEDPLVAWTRSIRMLASAFRHEPADRTWSVIDACAHLACNRLGTGMAGEDYVRYLAARSLVLDIRRDNRAAPRLDRNRTTREEF